MEAKYHHVNRAPQATQQRGPLNHLLSRTAMFI